MSSPIKFQLWMPGSPSWKPKQATLDLVAEANTIITRYAAQGYRMTLRQLYYQLVAANIIPNNQRSYSRLGSIMTRARWEGITAVDALYDPGREPRRAAMWNSPKELLSICADQYASDRWRNSPMRVELWAEKDAVASVLRPVATRYQVTYQSARGFMGLGALAEVAKRLSQKPTTIIYCGDHDASGQEIPRVIQEQLDRLDEAVHVDVVALTMTQIGEYDPPPQPAKLSDSRTGGYYDRHGTLDVWELDALQPDVLGRITSDAIEALLPDDYDDIIAADRATAERIHEMATTI